MGIGGCWAGKSKGVRAFFAPGARALRRASLDGSSRKLLTPLRGWILNWRRKYEWLREVVDQSEHSVKREMSEVKERRSGRRFLDRRNIPQPSNNAGGLFQEPGSYCGAFSEVVLRRWAMMSLASAMGFVVKGAAC